MSDGLDTKNLDKFLKALKGKLPTIRVGILGEKSARSSNGAAGGPTNAEVGSFHEFGTTKLPVRSFLRVPLMEQFPKRLKSSGAFDKAVLAEVIATKSVVPWLKKVAILAEGTVLDAFDSGDFGKWPPSDFRYKENAQTLVETQQLRNSITSDIQE